MRRDNDDQDDGQRPVPLTRKDAASLMRIQGALVEQINEHLSRDQHMDRSRVPFQHSVVGDQSGRFVQINVTQFPSQLVDIRTLADIVGDDYQVLVGSNFSMRRRKVVEREFSRTHCIVILCLFAAFVITLFRFLWLLF